jgi:hypothetical protein
MSYGSTLEKYLTKPRTSEKAFSPEGKIGGLVKSASDKWEGPGDKTTTCWIELWAM